MKVLAAAVAARRAFAGLAPGASLTLVDLTLQLLQQIYTLLEKSLQRCPAHGHKRLVQNGITMMDSCEL